MQVAANFTSSTGFCHRIKSKNYFQTLIKFLEGFKCGFILVLDKRAIQQCPYEALDRSILEDIENPDERKIWCWHVLKIVPGKF